ncbi:helix-turn-helix transcriptional regulator [Paenibacillus sp. YIM B09110]|uniref:helix-turn-helix transcriptional regulator n=1 Tax=Paenibacillus sp. YIM B09110 TaxID=3126102 RepID=UPI00301D003A
MSVRNGEIGIDNFITSSVDWLDQFSERLSLDDNKETLYRFENSSHGASGIIRHLRLREGMELVVSDLTFGDSLQIQSKSEGSCLELSFCIEGGVSNTVPGYYAKTPERAGHGFMLLSNQVEGIVDLLGGKRSCKVELMLDPIVWESYAMLFGGFELREELLMEFDKNPFNASEYRCSPAILSILRQIIECPFESQTRALFLEGKSLELMAVCAEQWPMNSRNAVHETSLRLRREDKEKIHQAGQLLVSQMEQPPSLLAIAQAVGINDWKLKKGFRELYGTTVFGYLRDRRLEMALKLMSHEGLNVNEASCAVGYNNPSYFARAFRNKYGVNPGEYINGFRS